MVFDVDYYNKDQDNKEQDNKDQENKEQDNNSENMLAHIPQSIRILIAECLYFKDFNGICDNDDYYEYTDNSGYLNIDKCLNNWSKISNFKFNNINILTDDTCYEFRIIKRKINTNKKALIIIYDGNPILIYKINQNYNEYYISNKIEIKYIHAIMNKLDILKTFEIMIENSPILKYYTKKYYDNTNIDNYNGYINVNEIIYTDYLR
jgi:hypothetical protein